MRGLARWLGITLSLAIGAIYTLAGKKAKPKRKPMKNLVLIFLLCCASPAAAQLETQFNNLLFSPGCGWEPRPGTPMTGREYRGPRHTEPFDPRANPWAIAEERGDRSCSSSECRAAARRRYGLDKWTKSFHTFFPPGGWCPVGSGACGQESHGTALYSEALAWLVTQPIRPHWLAGLGRDCIPSQKELIDLIATGRHVAARGLYCAKSGLCPTAPTPPAPPPDPPQPNPPTVQPCERGLSCLFVWIEGRHRVYEVNERSTGNLQLELRPVHRPLEVRLTQ